MNVGNRVDFSFFFLKQLDFEQTNQELTNAREHEKKENTYLPLGHLRFYRHVFVKTTAAGSDCRKRKQTQSAEFALCYQFLKLSFVIKRKLLSYLMAHK